MKSSLIDELTPNSCRTPVNKPLSLLGLCHKRTRTFDLRHTKIPTNNEYQLNPPFLNKEILNRKDSYPTKNGPLKEILKFSDFNPKTPNKSTHEPSNSSFQAKNSQKNKESNGKMKNISTEFLKDLTKIYDSSFKSSRTYREYQEFFHGQSQNLHKNIKSINYMDTNNLALSKEIFMSEETRQIMAKTLKNYEKNKEEMLTLIEGENYEFDLQKGRHKLMNIKYIDEFKATKVILIPFKGNFVVFISKSPKPDKEKHDFMFSINSFMIDYKHQTVPINEVFMNILALTELKAMIKIEFVLHEKENKQELTGEIIKRHRNSSLPAIFSPEDTKSYGSMSRNDGYIEKSSLGTTRNFIKLNIIPKKTGFYNNEVMLMKKQQEMEKKTMKVHFKRDQREIQLIFEKKIILIKKLRRKEENERRKLEKEIKLYRTIFYVNWTFIITLVTTVAYIKKLYLATKSIKAFQRMKHKKAEFIQKKFKDHLKSSQNDFKKNYFKCSISLIKIFYRVSELKVKHKAKRLVLKFLRDIKQPLIIRIKFFKILAKIVTIQGRWRLHYKSFNDKYNELNHLWEKGFKTYVEFRGFEPNQYQKEITIKTYLQSKLNIFYQDMRMYLSVIKNQTRAKTLALRFLSTAQKQDESSAEKEIRNIKKNSVFLFPGLEMSKMQSLMGIKKSHLSIKNKISEEDEEKSNSSSNSVDSHSIHSKNLNEAEAGEGKDLKKSILDENSIQRPRFKYIPDDVELRALIRKGVVLKKK